MGGNCLTQKTGENVAVQPLVVLPGWFVEQGKGNFNVKAMNAVYLAGFLRREDEKLETAQVRRIIAIAPCPPKPGDGGWTKSAATWNSDSPAQKT
jgi:hypothetical protein